MTACHCGKPIALPELTTGPHKNQCHHSELYVSVISLMQCYIQRSQSMLKQEMDIKCFGNDVRKCFVILDKKGIEAQWIPCLMF